MFSGRLAPPRQGARTGALALLIGAVAWGLMGGSSYTRLDAAALTHTFDTPEQLAEAVTDALRRRDASRLSQLALSEAEFRTHLWPYLPVSRHEGNVPFKFVWQQLNRRSQAYLQALLHEYGGRELRVIAVRFRGDTTDYGPVRVHRHTELVVRDESGRERTVRLFGSILVRGTRHKLFSYVVSQ